MKTLNHLTHNPVALARVGLVVVTGIVAILFYGTVVGSVYNNLGHLALTRAFAPAEIDLAAVSADYQRAHTNFGKALAWRPSEHVASRQALALPTSANLIGVGTMYNSAHDFAAAMEWYHLAIESGENISDGWYYVAFTTNWNPPSGQRDSQLALELFLTALEYDDFSSDTMKAETYYRIASLQCNYMGQGPDGCVPNYEQAVKLDARHAFAWMELGRQQYLQDNDLARAETTLAVALEVATEFQKKWAYFHLGEIYRMAEEYQLAQEQYSLALQIDPAFEQARDASKALP